MLDHLTPDSPVLSLESFAPSTPLPQTIDHSLLLRANQRWHDSSEGLRKIFASSPALRDTVNALLRERLQLDGEKAGFGFSATATLPQQFVSLTDACAFVVQRPILEASLDLQCDVVGVLRGHPLHALKPLQLLEKLKALNPQEAHTVRWAEFWQARAPGTPLTRRTHAIGCYRTHFEACSHASFARRVISAGQLDILQRIVDSGSAALAFKEQPLHTEKPALVLSNHSRVKLPGAWVISVGDRATASPMLYLPGRSVCIQSFATRAQMETWLSNEVPIPVGLPPKILRIEYAAEVAPMITGASDLFSDRQQAQLFALRHANRGKSGLREHGARALAHVELIDYQRRDAIIVAGPTKTLISEADVESQTPALFGNLGAAVPLTVRHAALKRERETLEQLLANDRDGTRHQQCRDALTALEAAEKTCETASTSLLERGRAADVDLFNTSLNGISQAHKDGLLAEAALQATLGQLDSDEHSLLKAVLDKPVAAERDADLVAASLTLSLTESRAGMTTLQRETLKGALVFTRQASLSSEGPGSSLLFYCPGSEGGLQRFADRRTLALEVFKLHEQDSESALQLDAIASDPLRHCLDELIADCETQAASLRGKPEQADNFEILRQACRAAVQVPLNAARTLMFAHAQEQARSGTLATHLPNWLVRLQKSERAGLRQLIKAYIEAMRKSHGLMTLALEPRDDFTRRHLHVRLRKDFAIEGYFSVQIEMPDSVKIETVVEATPAGPRRKTVIVPGPTRSTMSLEDLAQLNIDNVQSVLNDALSQRLIFMRLHVNTVNSQDGIRLRNGINLTWLRKVLPQLDLPKAYELRIREAFHGAPGESAYVRQHRRESLIEPWRLLLKIQAQSARLQKYLDRDDAALLEIAIDADTPQAWLGEGKRVVLLPISLGTGGKDTPNEGPVTLSGVTFIHDQISDKTLIYLPDSPNEQFFRRYDSLEAARKGLFRLCASDQWRKYLAGKALHGNVQAHIGRIGQAVSKNFDGIIRVGARWPASTSLAAHLLDAHMGRLIEAHRGSSRSNDALFLERYALQGPRAFNYIKMALGMVPFVGSVLALYDAWTAANQAVVAFLRGEVADGVAEIESMFLSLIDAFMDLLPGEALASTLSHTTRALTRARQLHTLSRRVAALHGKTQRQARQVLARFQGYDYEKPVSLSGIEPAPHGLYRGIYRHADGDFIERQGRIYQVELSSDSRSWRLSGTSRKSYKQPIALDETGHWDTWFGVYGTTLDGGLLGGGNVAGHLANALEPYWPAVVRERLPRWWTDRAMRRHMQLTDTADSLEHQIFKQVSRNNEAIGAYINNTDNARLRHLADLCCISDINLAQRRYEVLTELQPLTHGNKRRETINSLSDSARVVADRFRHRIYYASDRMTRLQNRIDDLVNTTERLAPDAISQRLRNLESIRQLRVEFVEDLAHTEALLAQLNQWYERITIAKQRSDFKLKENVETFNQRMTHANLLFLRAGQRMEIVRNYAWAEQLSWHYLQRQAEPSRRAVLRALYVQYSLSQIQTTPVQRNQMLSACVEAYTAFRQQMKAWTTRHPAYFHQEAVEPLLADIEVFAEKARLGITDLTITPQPAGKSTKKTFLTEDNHVLIGIEQWEPKSKKRQFILSEEKGQAGEVWELADNGRFRLSSPQAPQPAPADIARLKTDARRQLDAQSSYLAQVRSYAEQNMLPVDLEHMMVIEADDLEHRARDIEALTNNDAVIGQLRNKAAELRAIGRLLRTRQTLRTAKPTDGMLDDLMDQGAVEIRKAQPIKHLGKYNNHPDYMQEYEIWDITAEPRLLWYAHFHYRNKTPVLKNFETAHLKLPQHRFLTHADDATLPYSKIGKKSPVLRHFEALL